MPTCIELMQNAAITMTDHHAPHRQARPEPLGASLLALAEREARSVYYRLPENAVPLDDLVGYAHIGLVEARDRFDLSRGVPFEAFARHRIRGAMMDGLRRTGYFTRRGYEALRHQAIALCTVEPIPDPVGGPNLRHDAAVVSQAITQLANAFLLEAARPVEPVRPDTAVENAQALVKLRAIVKDLPEADQELIQYVYGTEALSEDELVKFKGVHRSTICRRHNKLLATLRQRLESPP